MSDMGFQNQEFSLAALLADHDRLHGRLRAFDEHGEGEHTPDEHERLNDEIRANVLALWERFGMAGVRAFVHLGHEMLDTAAHMGLPIDHEGNWTDEDMAASFAAMLADLHDLGQLIQLISLFNGQVPASHDEALAQLTEVMGVAGIQIIE